jgi:hypothetical protein
MRLQSGLICFTGCFMAARVAMDVYFESNLIAREIRPTASAPFVARGQGGAHRDGATAATVVFRNKSSGVPSGGSKRDRPIIRSQPTELANGNSQPFRAARANLTTSSPFAYAFVIGGCNPDNGRYMGFLYNVMVATKVLRDEGSLSDVVLLLQISPNTTASTIPERQQHALEALGIHMYYIPKSHRESFYDTVLNKFRVLQLVQYKKVMLLDADVMPLGNLDYLFTLDELRPNVIVSGALEPANGGVFVVSPGPNEYQQLQSIIERRNERSGSSAFDSAWGWGHEIRPPDEWVARRPGVRGTHWTFHFAFSDQGLLYHWTKYAKQNVSIVFEDRVENWGTSESGSAVLQETIRNPFVGHSKPRLRVYAMCHKFLCDIMHFSGTKKPWLPRPPKDISETTKHKDAFHLWWYTLRQIDTTVGLNIDYGHWRTWQEQPLGNYAVMPT